MLSVKCCPNFKKGVPDFTKFLCISYRRKNSSFDKKKKKKKKKKNGRKHVGSVKTKI